MKRTFKGLLLIFLITTTIPTYPISFGGFFSSLRNKTTLALASVATLCASMFWYARAKARSINILGGYAHREINQQATAAPQPEPIMPRQDNRHVPYTDDIRARHRARQKARILQPTATAEHATAQQPEQAFPEEYAYVTEYATRRPARHAEHASYTLQEPAILHTPSDSTQSDDDINPFQVDAEAGPAGDSSDSESFSQDSTRDLRLIHPFAQCAPIFTETENGLCKNTPADHHEPTSVLHKNWGSCSVKYSYADVIKGKKDRILFTPTNIAEENKGRKILLLAVHGTFSNPKGFGAESTYALAQAFYTFATLLAERYNTQVELWFPTWSGALSRYEREQAARTISAYIDSQHNLAGIWAIGHSHGCNVLSQVATQNQIDSAIYIASPACDVSEHENIKIGRVYSFYGCADITQAMGSLTNNYTFDRKPLTPHIWMRVHNIRIQQDGFELDHVNIKLPVVENLPWLLATIDQYYPESCDLDANIISNSTELPIVALRRPTREHPLSTYEEQRFQDLYGRSIHDKRHSVLYTAISEALSAYYGSPRVAARAAAACASVEPIAYTAQEQLRNAVNTVNPIAEHIEKTTKAEILLIDYEYLEEYFATLERIHETLVNDISRNAVCIEDTLFKESVARERRRIENLLRQLQQEQYDMDTLLTFKNTQAQATPEQRDAVIAILERIQPRCEALYGDSLSLTDYEDMQLKKRIKLFKECADKLKS